MNLHRYTNLRYSEVLRHYAQLCFCYCTQFLFRVTMNNFKYMLCNDHKKMRIPCAISIMYMDVNINANNPLLNNSGM